jgi:hypothetical protein
MYAPEDERLYLYSLHGSPGSKVGALRAMAFLGEMIPDDKRNECLDSWFADGGDAEIKNAALSYLASEGGQVDIEHVRTELKRNNYATRSAASKALIEIAGRLGKPHQESIVWEPDLDNLERSSLRKLFNEKWTNNELHQLAFSHKVSQIRATACEVLRTRKALPVTEGRRLLGDLSPYVRYEGLVALLDAGVGLDVSEANELLEKAPETPTGGLLGSYSINNLKDDWYKLYLDTLSSPDLSDLAAKKYPFNNDEYAALARRDLTSYRDELMNGLQEKFSKHFSEYKRKFRNFESDENMRELEAYYIGQRVTASIILLIKEGSNKSVDFIKQYILNKDTDITSMELAFLQTHCNWGDIGKIVALLGRVTLSDSLSCDAARLLVNVAEDNIDELLGYELVALRYRVIFNILIKRFRAIKRSCILDQLKSSDALVRKVAAIKCVMAFSVRTVKSILSNIMNGQTAYYNVIFWLDVGASVPSKLARARLTKVLGEFAGNSI